MPRWREEGQPAEVAPPSSGQLTRSLHPFGLFRPVGFVSTTIVNVFNNLFGLFLVFERFLLPCSFLPPT